MDNTSITFDGSNYSIYNCNMFNDNNNISMHDYRTIGGFTGGLLLLVIVLSSVSYYGVKKWKSFHRDRLNSPSSPSTNRSYLQADKNIETVTEQETVKNTAIDLESCESDITVSTSKNHGLRVGQTKVICIMEILKTSEEALKIAIAINLLDFYYFKHREIT